MNRFSINLATRPFRNNILHWAALVACVGFLVGFTWYNVDLYAGAGHDLERWHQVLGDHRQAVATLDREVDDMRERVEGIDLVAFSERSAFANEIILSRLFSWTSLFDRLEEVMPPKVLIRSIRPSIGKEMIEITIDGMTPNPNALLDFEESLIASEFFTFVYPIHESSRVKQGEINFSITFGYLPEGGNTGYVQDPVGFEEEEDAGDAGATLPAMSLDEIDPDQGDPNAPGTDEVDPNSGEDPNDFFEDDDGEEDGGLAP